MKTLWVVAREAEGDLVVRGQRLDAPGQLTFRRNQSERSTTLVVSNAATERGAVPGNAPPEIRQAYAFWPSEVFYPSMGCWELTAQMGDSEVRVVQNFTRKVETNCGVEEAP